MGNDVGFKRHSHVKKTYDPFGKEMKRGLILILVTAEFSLTAVEEMVNSAFKV